MARRADHTREELKKLAIIAGYNLIQKDGFGKFSARKVAAEIGYTIGTIYNVFGSHDGLILAINAMTLDDWYAEMEKALKKARGNKVKALAAFYLDYSRRNYNNWLALFEHHLPQGEKLPEWYEVKMLRLFAVVEEVIRPLVKGDDKKAQLAGKVLWSGIHGIATLAHSGKLDVVGNESAEKLAESLVDNYINGLEAGR